MAKVVVYFSYICLNFSLGECVMLVVLRTQRRCCCNKFHCRYLYLHWVILIYIVKEEGRWDPCGRIKPHLQRMTQRPPNRAIYGGREVQHLLGMFRRKGHICLTDCSKVNVSVVEIHCKGEENLIT